MNFTESNHVDPITPVDKIASTDPDSEINNLTPTIDKDLIAEDPIDPGPQNYFDNCPGNKKFACCWIVMDIVGETWVRKRTCWWRRLIRICTDFGSGWQCCGPKSEVSNPYALNPLDRYDPDPETCEEYQVPPPPGTRKKPKIQSNEDPIPICLPRKAPAGVD